MNHRNTLVLSAIFFVVGTLQPNHVYAQDQYDCSFSSDLDVSGSGDGSFLFRHSIHPELQVINVELEYKGIGWVGISFSESVSMVPNVAVIGLPDDNAVLKYNLAGKVTSSVTALSSDTLTNVNITYSTDKGSTILKFTKPLQETDETTIAAGGNSIILVAYGTSNTLDYHAYRASKPVTLNECVLAGTTLAPVVPAPPTSPAPVASAPVASPTSSTGPGTVNDLGNGRIDRTLSFEGGDVTLSILTDSVAETLTVTMVYFGIGWLAFAISDDELMPNSNAVMAFPTGAEGAAEKWDIGDGRTASVVTKVSDSTRKQTLTDATYTQNATHTVMTFTKPLVDGSEIPVAIDGVNFFLYAVGTDNNFGIHATRLGFPLDLGATNLSPIDISASDTKTLWMVHGILMFIAWSILVPMAVGTALLRNFLPLPTGMWFQIHRILNSIAVLCTIVGFAIAVRNISEEQGSTAKHFSNYQHHKIGLVIFIFSIIQALTGIFRPHLPKQAEVTSTEHDAEDGTLTKTTESNEPAKKSPSRIAFEIQHRLMGTVAMILGWFNVDSGIGLYSFRFDSRELVAVPWVVTGVIVFSTLVLYLFDRFRGRKAE